MIRRLFAALVLPGLALSCGKAFGAGKEETKPSLKPGLYASFDTSEGTFLAELYEKHTPIAVRNFVELARGIKPWLDSKTMTMVRRPLYQDILFHRVTPGVMIQAGDPTGTGGHNCGVSIPDEFLPGLQFSSPGRLAVANSGRENSGGCQFFVTDQACPNGTESTPSSGSW